MPAREPFGRRARVGAMRFTTIRTDYGTTAARLDGDVLVPLDAAELADFLEGKVARWQVPEYWAFVAEVPKTAVGKFDKKVLRARDAAGDLAIEHITR